MFSRETVLFLIVAAGAVLQAMFIAAEHREKYIAADILKGAASLMFVLLGYIAYHTVNNAFNRQFFMGLLFGMIGDILLNLRFVFEKSGQKIFLAGILAFLIGHVIYLLALIPQARYGWFWPCVAIGAALLLAYIFRTMEVKTAFKIFGVFYLGAVFIMTAIALGIAFFVPSRRTVLYAIGAVLFTASDVVLIFNTFSGVSKFSRRIINLTLYYAGQMLIACSLFF